MSIDLSFLSSDTLLFFLTHSTAFVVTVASVFFAFGLAFGWLTWGRLKWQRRLLLAEAESLKDEVATLKRKLAEQASRLASSPDNAAPSGEPAEEKHHAPDPVIHSFLSAAAAVLPQTRASIGIPYPAHAAPPAADAIPADSRAGAMAGSEAVTAELPAAALGSLPSKSTAPATDAAVEPGSGSDTANGKTSSTVAALPGNGEARLLSDPHLGLVYCSRPSLADDLNQLKGVAHIIEGRLNEFGVHTFKQIALWNDENISEFSQRLSFKDRIRRERWVEQARELHFQKYGERL